MTRLDPTTCFHEMADAMDQYDFPTARENALTLAALLRSGGRVTDVPADDVTEFVKGVLARTIYPD
jgi:hypothetical protein